MASRVPRSLAAHLRPSDLRAVSRLAVDATLGVTGVVEQLHHTILKRTRPWGTEPPPGGTPGVTGFVYSSVRGITRLVGGGLDLALQPVQAWLEGRDGAPVPASSERLGVLAALNGVVGDRLEASGNPLALPTEVLQGDRPLPSPREAMTAALAGASPHLLLVIHGLCMHPGQLREDLDLGERLAASSGRTVLYLRYNSGRPVVASGRDLADWLARLEAAWPVPLRSIAILAHSMGGLVARSACMQAQAGRQPWLRRLQSLVFLGTPHQGAPLERGGHAVEQLLRLSPYTAAFSRLTGLRSAGIRDLRLGNVADARAAARDGSPLHVSLPEGVNCFAVAGALATPLRASDKLVGDGLVTVDSALGRHPDPARALAFEPSAQWIAQGQGHLDLLHDAGVLDQLKRWLPPV